MSSQNNGREAAFAQFETPFADATKDMESNDQIISSEDIYNQLLPAAESPFSRTYEPSGTGAKSSPVAEEYVNLLGELDNQEFVESLYEMASDLEERWRSNINNELAMGNNYQAYVARQAKDYFEPLQREFNGMIEKLAQHFSGNDLAGLNESAVEQLFETIEYDHSALTPAQDQFLGNVFKKVRSVASTVTNLAKKGANLLGKLSPLHLILKKLEPLMKPILDRVLKFAIGKLPKNLQPHAQGLAKKYLNQETPFAGTDNYAMEETSLDAIQTELDNNIAQLLFTPDENEANNIILNYETAADHLERNEAYNNETYGGAALDAARQQFINELRNLQEGENPAPAIERFLPVAIMALRPAVKIALKMVGRKRVIDFLAGMLSNLISKYVPSNISKPLASNIIDVGMSAIGFEVQETTQSDIAYETIANTIEETIQHMTGLTDEVLSDNERLAVHTLDAFEKAAADNFPAQYIRSELRPNRQKAIWVKMPRRSPVKFYKKFTHIYDVTIDPKAAAEVKIYRNLPLANFLKDKYGLDASKPIKAKAYLYEATAGTRLSLISRSENLPGLNARQPKAWVQLLPLTKEAASILLKEESLGTEFPSQNAATRFRTVPGQRFYYLEIEGARLRIPQVNRSAHKHASNGQPLSSIESRSADVQAVINFVRSEIRLNYYLSEEDAKAVVEKLNSNDMVGTAISIRQTLSKVLNSSLLNNVQQKVKIIHEAFPELYLENMQDSEGGDNEVAASVGKQLVKTVVEKLTEKICGQAYEAVLTFFKSRAAEFKGAQALPQDGVTIKIMWLNVTGMSTIRTIINAVQGKLSLGSIDSLSLPNLSVPQIQVVADKKFI